MTWRGALTGDQEDEGWKQALTDISMHCSRQLQTIIKHLQPRQGRRV